MEDDRLVRDYEDKGESGAITKGQRGRVREREREREREKSGEEKEKCGLLQLVLLSFPMKQKSQYRGKLGALI